MNKSSTPDRSHYIENVKEEGRHAFRSNLPKICCPYFIEELRKAWCTGWEEARAETNEPKEN